MKNSQRRRSIAHNQSTDETQCIGSSSISSALNNLFEVQTMNTESNDVKPNRIFSFYKAIRSILKDYCSNTTVHGIRYFVEPGRHWIERIWWMVVMIVSIILCTYTILNIWTQWQDELVIVTIDDKPTSIETIPFPAVTICPVLKFTRNKIDIDMNHRHIQKTIDKLCAGKLNVSSEIVNQLDAIGQVCVRRYGFGKFNIASLRSESIYSTIRKVAPEMSSTIQLSKFMGQSAQFHPIFTDEGLCYTFNSLNSRDIYTDDINSEILTVQDTPMVTQWNINDGYSYETNHSEELVYPYRVFGVGSRHALQLQLGVLIDVLQSACLEAIEGLRLSLHSPDELPRSSDDFIYISAKRTMHIAIKPNLITTSEGLRNYAPNDRGCFRSERQLRLFKSYSQQKCELECLSNFMKTECGCLKYSIPGLKNQTICTINKLTCYNNALFLFANNLAVSHCNCLPACTSIAYHMEISHAQTETLEEEELIVGYMKKTALNTSNATTTLTISFKQTTFMALKRIETSTMADFIANCGGLLGLFMGISALSVVELIYYFTLRVFYTLRLKTIETRISMIESPNQEENNQRRLKAVAKIRCIIWEFCSETNVHGFRYLTEPKRHWIEKIWWAIALIASICLCTYTTLSIWTNWQEQPVIVTVNDKPASIGTIPFPAVTICSNYKFNDKIDIDHLIRVMDELNKTLSLTSETVNHLDALYQICLKEAPNVRIGNFNPQRNESIYKTLEKIVPGWSSVVPTSSFQGYRMERRPIFTGEGLCYTFNSLSSQDIYTNEINSELMTVNENLKDIKWNLENGYTYEKNFDERKVYPRRVVGTSDQYKMRLDLNLNKPHKHCKDRSQGVRLSLHLPDELPRSSDDFIYIPNRQGVFIKVKPNMITTPYTLRSHSPEDRGCLFRSERQLRFFKFYSQSKCELECLANFTATECGCVKFSMPGDRNTKTCTVDEFRCYDQADEKFSMDFIVSKCNCLPDCISLTYDLEVSQAKSFWEVDMVYISFKESQFIALKRTETSTMADFIANCGGLLGLFMGISALSFVEFIYYFTLRLFCTLKQQKSNQINDSTWAAQSLDQNASNSRINQRSTTAIMTHHVP